MSTIDNQNKPGYKRKYFFKKSYKFIKKIYHDWFGDVHIFFKNKIQDTRPHLGPFLDILYTTLSIIILIFFSIIFVYSLFVHSGSWYFVFYYLSWFFIIIWIFTLPILFIGFILDWFRSKVDNNFFLSRLYYFIYTLIFWFFSFLYMTIHDFFVN